MLIRFFILWSINKIHPDFTVCVKIDHNGNFTSRPTTVCQEVFTRWMNTGVKECFERKLKTDDIKRTRVHRTLFWKCGLFEDSTAESE